MKGIRFLILLLLSLCFTQSEVYSQIELKWESEEISECVYWKSYTGNDLFDSVQSVNMIQADLSCSSYELTFAWSDSTLIPTSQFGMNNGAIAAVNGTFFDVQRGGSVVFFKVKDEVITRGAVNRRLYSESGGISIGEDGAITVLARPEDGWLTTTHSTVMGSGPLLILNGEQRNLSEDPFNQNRHPRTAVGLTEDDMLLLITVDGRSSLAHGMSTPELQEFMDQMGAVYALNLDGGGSTTMWIDGFGENGIVNYPSDNRQFDRQGERGVANVLLLVPKK
jgi:exopolysaccharide biosynthesis protein